MNLIFGKLKNGDWIIGDSDDKKTVKSPYAVVIMPNKTFIMFDIRQGLTPDDVEISISDFLFTCIPSDPVSDAYFQAKTGIAVKKSKIIKPNGSVN